MISNNWLSIISPEEMQILRAAGSSGRMHPVAALALREGNRQVAVNTERAARHIVDRGESWLRSLRKRLLQVDDFTAASSALGEIRAHGSLLETWCSVSPTPTVEGSGVRPEFEVDAGDGKVIIEVHSRQLDEDQVRRLADHETHLKIQHAAKVDEARSANVAMPVITFGEIEVFPTGAPMAGKVGDSVLTNTISRVASIKLNEKQVDPSKPFVLWLDLQDPEVWGLPLADELFRPLYTMASEGSVSSGPFWFALYGRAGDPLLESCGYSYRSTQMLHPGRFFQTIKSHSGPTRLSGVVYSLPRATILMENPEAAHPLPERFRAAMLKAPFFRLDLSILEWRPGLVRQIIDLDRQIIDAAIGALENFDPAA